MRQTLQPHANGCGHRVEQRGVCRPQFTRGRLLRRLEDARLGLLFVVVVALVVVDHLGLRVVEECDDLVMLPHYRVAASDAAAAARGRVCKLGVG